MKHPWKMLAAGLVFSTALAGCGANHGELGNKNIHNNATGNYRLLDKRFADDGMNKMNRINGNQKNGNNIVGNHQNYHLSSDKQLADKLVKLQGIRSAYVITSNNNAYVAVGLDGGSVTGKTSGRTAQGYTPGNGINNTYNTKSINGMTSTKIMNGMTGTNGSRYGTNTNRTGLYEGGNSFYTDLTSGWSRGAGFSTNGMRPLSADAKHGGTIFYKKSDKIHKAAKNGAVAGQSNYGINQGNGVAGTSYDGTYTNGMAGSNYGLGNNGFAATPNYNANNGVAAQSNYGAVLDVPGSNGYSSYKNGYNAYGTGVSTNNRGHMMNGLSDNNNRYMDRELDSNVKNKIAEVVRMNKTGIKNVYVSANPDFYSRMQGYSNDVIQGHPIQGFVSEFSAMVERIFPAQAAPNGTINKTINNNNGMRGTANERLFQ